VEHDDIIAVPETAVRFEDGRTKVVAPFAIGRWPVTVGQFATFCKATGHVTAAERAGRKQTYADNDALRKVRANFKHKRYGFLPYERVEDVEAYHLSFADATAYCCWAGVRLPTEAEWLAAAVQDWDRRVHPDAMLDAINDHGQRPRALKAIGTEWTADTHALREVGDDAVPPVYPFVPQRSRRPGEWVILRNGPMHVLSTEWERNPFLVSLAPPEFFHATVIFRVCR